MFIFFLATFVGLGTAGFCSGFRNSNWFFLLRWRHFACLTHEIRRSDVFFAFDPGRRPIFSPYYTVQHGNFLIYDPRRTMPRYGKRSHKGQVIFEKRWFPNGRFYISFQNAEKSWTSMTWYPNGKLEYYTYYVNVNTPHESQLGYFPNGNLAVERAVNSGTLIWFREYHQNGRLRARGFYGKKGPEKRWEWWDKNGDTLATTEFVDGTGVRYEFSLEDVKLTEYHYVHGELHGRSFVWNEQGNLSKTDWFDNGNSVSEQEFRRRRPDEYAKIKSGE